MFSHYCEGHKGYCLEFEATNYTEFFGEAQPVNYEEEFPVINPLHETPDEMVNKGILTKFKHWEYEREWRIIRPGKGSTVQTYPGELLKGIIFGHRMKEEHKIQFQEWADRRKSPIQFYQAQIKEREFGLDIVSVD